MTRRGSVSRVAVAVALAVAAACGGSTPPPPLTGALSVSVGSSHACAVMADGTATCWGSNAAGELGNGQQGTLAFKPVAVAGLTSVQAITAGTQHTCALLADGSVACWGQNAGCELGHCGAPEPVPTPTAVSGLSAPAVAIQAGAILGDSPGFTCAALSDGTVACWGENAFGLGADPMAAGIPPTAVDGATGAVGLALGGTFGCALQAAGTVLCWGAGPLVGSSSPVVVPGLFDARAIAAGWFHVCALRSDGTVVCWGNNSSGQLGDGTHTDSPTPVQVSGLTNAVAISTSGYATCAALADGSLRCWGIDLSKPSPTPVSGLSTVTSVSAAELTICAVVANGEIRCWGNDEYGQLGDGKFPPDTGDLTSPPVTVIAD